MRYPNPNILVYIGMADAYAAACEYLLSVPWERRVYEQCLQFRGYVRHPRHLGLKPSCYTDDTEMSVANARVLIENDPPYIPLMFANYYVREFERGGRREGYARGFQKFLESVRSGEEFLGKIRSGSTKNGAAMRAVPFGTLRTPKETMEVATLQARITHDTREGRFSARAVALMAHFALYEEAPLSDVASYCLREMPAEDVEQFGYVFQNPWPENKPVKDSKETPVAISTVHAVAHFVRTARSLMDILERVIRMGGDTDSVAAIAWGIASARFRNERLPEFLERDLEQGNPATGVACLRDIGEKLMRRFA